jgi:PAS domain S-box-containing protein
VGIIKVQKELQKRVEDGRQLRQKERIQQLTLSNQQYPFYIMMILAVVAGIFLISIFIVFIFNRRAARQMHLVNLKLTEEIREREFKEQQTRNSERKFRFFSENSVDFITMINHNMERLYTSPSCRLIYGYEPEEMLSISLYDLAVPKYHDEIDQGLKKMLDERTPKQFIYEAIKKDRSQTWVESMVNPLFDVVTGEYKGMIAVTRDIQERKTKELEIMQGTKQKEVLLKEIHHRVKNNFAILVSLINMQMNQVKDRELQKSLTNLQLRIRSMALVHEMLYRSDDFEKISFPDYLRSMASVISGTFGRRDIDLTIEAEDAVIDIDASIPLGLIVNELLSNAFIHAFPEGRSGKIFMGFNLTDEPSQYQLIIKDDGVGLPETFSMDHVDTMGLQIVQLLTRQIEGTLVFENSIGSSFSITFEIPGS